MRFIRTGSACALLLAAHACALAQDGQPAASATADAESVHDVRISVGLDARRARSTTTAIVVGRDEILRHGDTSLLDVLGRQPGITLDRMSNGGPGKPAAVRMRGMGAGYAAILLNGLSAPNGFTLDSLAPEQVERIEILRAATAETSGQAMAGTINVILRRAGAGPTAAPDDVKAGAAFHAGHAAPTFTGEHAGRRGALAYAVAATIRRSDRTVDAVVTEEGDLPALLRRTRESDRQVEDVLELAPRLSWQDGGADTLTAQATLRKRRYDGRKHETETTDIGSPTAFPQARSSFHMAPAQAYGELSWTRRLDGGARLAARLSGAGSGRDAQFDYRGADPASRLRETHRVLSGIREREWTFAGSWRRSLGASHLLAVGWEAGRKRRAEYRRERQSDAAGLALLDSDEDFDAQVTRGALFVQDEWDITAAWSAYLGLRREDLRTHGGGSAHGTVDVRAGAWSPIAQTLFKPKRGMGQFRLAVSRTYKAPEIARLMPRRYTVDNNNSAANPDQQGNPNLRPELAFGIDLAWERFEDKSGKDGKVGMTSVSLFRKRIRDIVLNRIGKNGGVWTVMPDNAGNATVQGIEFEARRTRGPLAARVNLAHNRSRVDALPGPDNRLPGQPAWTGNLGLDYAASNALDLGGTWSMRSGSTARTDFLIVEEQGARRQLDLVAVWRPGCAGRAGRLRMSVSDLLHGGDRDRTIYLGEAGGTGRLMRTTAVRAYPTWRVVWEQSL